MKATMLSLFLVVTAALATSACGGGGSNPGAGDPPTTPSISITVSPASATAGAGGTQQFTATVTGSSDTTATWSMTSTATTLPGQDPGAVSASGLYTAPATVGGTFTVTVTATAAADTSATASATVTVNPPSTQPSLVWLQAPGAADITNNIQPQLGMDGSGNVFFSAGVGSLSAWKLNPSGTVLSSFTSTDAINPNAVVSDGTNFYIPSQLNDAPALLSLDSNLNKRYESTPCGTNAQGWASAALWGDNSLGLLLALGSGSTPSFAVSANAATGQFPCSGGIETNPTPDSIVYSLTLSQAGNLTAFGFFPNPDSGPVCWSGTEGFLGQSTMVGQSVWLTPFIQLVPSTLAYDTRAAETVENGKDVVYVTGRLATCAGIFPLWVAKYDGTTGAQLWSQTWDGGNDAQGAGVSGQPTPLPLPGGGVAVVGSMTQVGEVPPTNGHSTSDMVFAAWDADGNQLVATHVPIMNSADIIMYGAALTPDGTGFYAGGMLYGLGEGLIMKFTLSATLAGN